jgi:hypothetical protein
MADPPDPRHAAEGLVMICEDWLRRLARDGGPLPNARVRAVLAWVALAAPGVAAAHCPMLLGAVGPSVACRVKAQASVPPVGDVARAAADQARWITPQQAAAVLGITAHGVRDLLRRHRLEGRRCERGWQVDAASVRRRYDRAAAA